MAITVAATAQSSITSNTTNHVVDLPSGIVSGNLLIIFIAVNNAPTTTEPTGWSSAGTSAFTGDKRISVFYKVATGSEGATATVTTSGTGSSTRSSSVAWRVTGHDGNPQGGGSANGSTSNPDSSTLSPSGGSAAYMWISAVSGRSDFTVSSYPSNYTDNQTSYANGSSFSHVILSSRNLTASSEDPGSYTMSASGRWAAITIAIKELAASGPANLKSYNTNVKANIKSINTNVIANIKSLNTNV